MAWSAMSTIHKGQAMSRMPQIVSRKKEMERENSQSPYRVVEISPPPTSLGVRWFPSNLQCGESVTIEGQAYIISAVTYRYHLRKGRYEPHEKRLDVLSTGREGPDEEFLERKFRTLILDYIN